MKIKKRYFKLTTAPKGFRTEPLITFVKADVSEGDEGDVLRAEVIAQAENQNLIHPDDYGDWNEELMTCDEISEEDYWSGLRANDVLDRVTSPILFNEVDGKIIIIDGNLRYNAFKTIFPNITDEEMIEKNLLKKV